MRATILSGILGAVCLFGAHDWRELRTAQGEERQAWELREKLKAEGYSLTRFGPGKSNLVTVPADKTDTWTIREPMNPPHAWMTVKPDGEVIFSPELIKAIQDAVRATSFEEQKPGFIIGKQNNILGAMPPPGSFVIDDPDGPGTITVIPQLRLISPSQARTFRMKEDEE